MHTKRFSVGSPTFEQFKIYTKKLEVSPNVLKCQKSPLRKIVLMYSALSVFYSCEMLLCLYHKKRDLASTFKRELSFLQAQKRRCKQTKEAQELENKTKNFEGNIGYSCPTDQIHQATI